MFLDSGRQPGGDLGDGEWWGVERQTFTMAVVSVTLGGVAEQDGLIHSTQKTGIR